MIYIRRFNKKSVVTTSGGRYTSISADAIRNSVFPEPQEYPGEDKLKFYSNNEQAFVDSEKGYLESVYGIRQSNKGRGEVALKDFADILDKVEVKVSDVAIFKKREDEENAYDVFFIKQESPGYSFFSKFFTSADNHALINSLADTREGINRPSNWLIYGAPGTGKSHFLEEEAILFGNNKKRITFYPDYSYSKFIGSYKPITFYRASNHTFHLTRTDPFNHPENILNEPVIDYTFVPGPFLTSLVSAYKGLNSKENFLLIIEELNRANAASIFGEVFQLLDRKNGESEYRVRLADEAMLYIIEQLQDTEYEELRNKIDEQGLFIPGNFYIWATMNSADQGVFPLDSAFKRRWSPFYMPLNKNEGKVPNVNLNFGNNEYHWNSLRKAINDYLVDKGVTEDRLIGPFYLSTEELSDAESLNDTFRNKVLLYLKDDVLRHKKVLFKSGITTFTAILEKFNEANSYDFFSIISEDATKDIMKNYEDYVKVYKSSQKVAEETKPDNDVSAEAKADVTPIPVQDKESEKTPLPPDVD
jgi:hypothetical protein